MTLYEPTECQTQMAQGLDSTRTNNLTLPVTQCVCVCVTPQSAYKKLKLRCQCIIWIADKASSLHNKLRSRAINMVGKHKQVHVLTAGLVSIRHDTWFIREY